MTITVCDMQLEDAAAQSVLWKNLNVVLAKYGIPKPKSKGFMADSAQANWNAIRVIFGSGDVVILIKDQREHVYSTGHSRWRSIPRSTSRQTSKINIGFCVCSISMQLHLVSLKLNILSSRHGGSPPGPQRCRA
jgi:hypothetical protein